MAKKLLYIIPILVVVVVIASIFVFFMFGEKKTIKPEVSDFSKCEKELGKTTRAICYTEIAIEKNDVSICGKYLENEEDKKFKDLCYRDFAIKNKDKTICEKIESNYIKDQCKETLGEKQEETAPAAQQKVEYKNCGSSDDCFSDYVKTCTPAKATISRQGLTYIETAEGYEGDNCILTFVYTESSASGFVGKEATCKVPKSNLANFKDYFQGKNTKQSCEGSLVDLLIQMGAI